MPEFVYEKTDYKDQSVDPIFDLHQRNSGNLNALTNDYFFGKDRVPDSEFLAAKLSWQKRIHNNKKFALQLVKKNEDKFSGITIHFVNDEYDKGLIIFQKKIKLNISDSVEIISKKVQELEHYHYPRVIENLL